MATGSYRESEADSNKRLYEKPILKVYGSVKTLTASGSGTNVEQGPNTAGTCGDKNTHRKSCLSDRRTKRNIVRVGTHSLGTGLYLFEYKLAYRQMWGHGRQFGVMADEVEKVLPEAVSVHPDGYKMVDYAILGISRTLQ